MRSLSCLGLVAVLATALTASAASAAIYATEVDWSGSAARGDTNFDATSRTFTPGTRSEPGDALGMEDQVGNTNGGFLSLGIGGIAVFGFGQAFGTEATIFEVTFGCNGPQNGDLCNYDETADVYVWNGDYTPFDGAFDLSDITDPGGVNFQRVDSIPNGLANRPEGVTISIAGPFTYLALVDTSRSGGGRDGFDVDAVSVSPVPLPAALPLLAFGIVGLGYAARRQRRYG